jgi:hypothetical protein
MMVEKARTDKATREELDQGVFAVCHDFTRYYNKAGKEAVASARL